MTEAGRYCLFETRIGVFGIAWSGHGLTKLQLPEADERATVKRLRARSASTEAEESPARVAAAISMVRRYLEGENIDFSSIELDLAASDPFHAKVYDAARQVGWGEVSTYGDLARRIGSPRESREVGQALARNPVAIIIPCHRILMKGMRIGGFSAHGGTRTKRRLLALEGVSLDEGLLPGLLEERGAR